MFNMKAGPRVADGPHVVRVRPPHAQEHRGVAAEVASAEGPCATVPVDGDAALTRLPRLLSNRPHVVRPGGPYRPQRQGVGRVGDGHLGPGRPVPVIDEPRRPREAHRPDVVGSRTGHVKQRAVGHLWVSGDHGPFGAVPVLDEGPVGPGEGLSTTCHPGVQAGSAATPRGPRLTVMATTTRVIGIRRERSRLMSGPPLWSKSGDRSYWPSVLAAPTHAGEPAPPPVIAPVLCPQSSTG